MQNSPEVSVVVVSWNTKGILRQCLESVYQQTRNVNFELIVVDNASSDDSVAMVRAEFPSATVVQNSVNRGFAAANNQGIALAKGRYILLLNPDTIVLNSAVENTVQFADAHEGAAAIAPRVLNADRTLQMTCFMFPSVLNMLLSTVYLSKLFPRNRFFGREQMTWWDRNDAREVDVVDGCFMLVRRDAIEQVGTMDERFFMYCEETDWCFRFKKAGWKLLFTAAAQIIHLGGQSSRQAASEMTLQLRGSILQFMRKHRSRLAYRAACLLTWLFFAVRVPVWLAAFAVKRTDHCRSRVKTYLDGMRRLLLCGGKGLCARTDANYRDQ